MWVFTEIGFFSAVENRQDGKRKTVLVRARLKEDIDALNAFLLTNHGKKYPVQRTPDRDYLFRIVIEKTTWGEVLLKLGSEISYGNFKPHVHGDPERDQAYARCWSAMHSAQHARA